MIKGKWICLVTTILLVCGTSDLFGDERLNEEIIDRIAQYYELGDEVEIEIRKNRLAKAVDDYDSLWLKPLTKAEPRGLLPVMVYLYKDGAEAAKGQIRVKIGYYQEVLVTQSKIRRNDIIVPGLFSLERREVTHLKEKALTSVDQYPGYRAKRNITKDQILTDGMIEKIPAVTPGGEVSIVYKKSGIEISASGVALEDGYVGDIIRVRNNQSRKIIACTIVDNGTVRVSSH